MGLKLENISRTFADKTVVKNITLAAKPGEIIGILGTSGCGKSTLLRAISGLDQDYDGHVFINDQPSRGIHEQTGFIFQEPRLLPWLNVIENITFGLKGKKQANTVMAEKYVKHVGLEDHSDLYPRQLSGGMAQRVAIARALVTSPEILLLDEPFSALDAFTKMQLQDLLLDIWKIYQSIMVLVTHDIDEAIYLCDRIIILRGEPGEITHEMSINDAHPRERGSERAAKLKTTILESLDLNKTISTRTT